MLSYLQRCVRQEWIKHSNIAECKKKRLAGTGNVLNKTATSPSYVGASLIEDQCGYKRNLLEISQWRTDYQ